MVNIADSCNLICDDIGTGKIIVSLPRGRSLPVTIENILHVPKCRNLLSMGQLNEKGLDIQIEPEEGCYLYQNRRLTGFAKMHKHLFLLNTIYKPKHATEFEHVDKVILEEVKEEEQEKKTRLDAELWHQRLGHVSCCKIGSMEGAVSGMSLEEEKGKAVANPECEDCIKGTISRKPFHPPRHQATQILEPIYTDSGGPISAKKVFRLCISYYHPCGSWYQARSHLFSALLK